VLPSHYDVIGMGTSEFLIADAKAIVRVVIRNFFVAFSS
jgi:hypothetical protein